MLRWLLTALTIFVTSALVVSFAVTRDGKVITPVGEGTITIGNKTFEAFPLPNYAAAFINDEYKSYLVEVESGIKVHILEVGTGYPIYMQHGNPTSGFLYRKVAEHLPTDRFRIIMPTMVGLGFSSKVPVADHTVENHNRWLNTALSELALDKLIYVGQDWGGIIGVGALSLSPELIEGIVMMNTAIYAPTEKCSFLAYMTLSERPLSTNY